MPTKKNRIETILSNEEKAILEAKAKAEGLSMSKYLKKIMLEASSEHKNKKE